MSSTETWQTRTETAEDVSSIRSVVAAAFPTVAEADLVDALRRDDDAWIPDLSIVATAPGGEVVGHALLTRCSVGGTPALALAPCSVAPGFQGRGVGSAATRAALAAARSRGENAVVVLGHPEYYPRFGFTPASRSHISAPFEVSDEAFMALFLDPAAPAPTGVVAYAAPFGI